MIDDKIFDDMNLPFANSNEELETISNNLFKPLFDVKKFEIRDEIYRDKGIDLHIEIKRENSKKQSVYLNFRFVIQLKATESKGKNDHLQCGLRTLPLPALLDADPDGGKHTGHRIQPPHHRRS